MKYLKYFEQASDYEAYKNGSEFVLPNVSYVENSDVVMYNPNAKPASPNVVCVYNITDISRETEILENYGLATFKSMIVDGVEMEIDCFHQFDTVGEHTIEFVLYDTNIYENTFGGNEEFQIVSISIPEQVTFIHYNALAACRNTAEIIFYSPNINYGDGNYYWVRTRLPETGVFKYPKGADYTGFINALPSGWTVVEI